MTKKILTLLVLIAFSNPSWASVSLPEFKKLVAIFHKEYDAELKSQNAVLLINHNDHNPDMWWNMPNIHAAYSSYTGPTGIKEHYIFLLGGYARIEGMTMEGIANTLCHELGHGIGGPPYKDKTEGYLISTEGQADYFATRFCIKRILRHLPSITPTPLDGFVDDQCKKSFSTDLDRKMCWRGFQVLESERLFFRIQKGIETETFYDRPVQKKAIKTDTTPTFYPSAQCRLDTMVNGILGLGRPACWWKG